MRHVEVGCACHVAIQLLFDGLLKRRPRVRHAWSRHEFMIDHVGEQRLPADASGDAYTFQHSVHVPLRAEQVVADARRAARMTVDPVEKSPRFRLGDGTRQHDRATHGALVGREKATRSHERMATAALKEPPIRQEVGVAFKAKPRFAAWNQLPVIWTMRWPSIARWTRPRCARNCKD